MCPTAKLLDNGLRLGSPTGIIVYKSNEHHGYQCLCVQALLHLHKALGLFVGADVQGQNVFKPYSAPAMAAAARCIRFLELPKGLAQPSIYQRYWVTSC